MDVIPLAKAGLSCFLLPHNNVAAFETPCTHLNDINSTDPFSDRCNILDNEKF